MICRDCNAELDDKSFLIEKDRCYRCIYIEKTKGLKRKRKCRICKEIIKEETDRNKQRDLYCSHECALKGHKEKINSYWTRVSY